MADITPYLIQNNIERYIDSVAEDSYYVFVGRLSVWPDDNNPPASNNSIQSLNDVSRNIVVGKRLTTNDVCYMLERNDWQSGQVYLAYDDTVDHQYTEHIYVINTVGNVYKCLSNNGQAPSVIEPVALSVQPFTTADGYVWKYMYSISSANASKFSSSAYVPVDANSAVESAAIDGAIDQIVVTSGGSGYLTVSGTVQQVVTSSVIRLENSLPNNNDHYRNSTFYVVNGTGAGTVATISSYVANGSGRFVALSEPVAVDLTSQYNIAPSVVITGDGSGARAFCSIDNGVITDVTVVSTGSGYHYGDVTIVANTNFGSGATARAIFAPPGGHGSDPFTELYGKHIGLSVDLIGDESGTIPDNFTFRQTGILYNPFEANTTDVFDQQTFNQTIEIDYTAITGETFTAGEVITGSTSGSSATVAAANSSVVIAGVVSSEFIPGESIIGQVSGTIGQVDQINTSDLEPFSGKILFYTNVVPVTRDPASTETIRTIIEI